ncbi:hypothetical protein [Castellaniella sp.]|uniref:hypothetical protein n=1 Tax=Castellaniella sp. TaxID=1955812 RepID=UPI002AFF9AD2|nr:hypothetical protein [Castellaniella sp.]
MSDQKPSLQRPLCNTCGKPATGFVCAAIEKIPQSLDEQYDGVRRFEPGDPFYFCPDHQPKN